MIRKERRKSTPLRLRFHIAARLPIEAPFGDRSEGDVVGKFGLYPGSSAVRGG